MKFSIDVATRIIEAINAKIPQKICPLCKVDDWSLSFGYVVINILEDPSTVMGGRGMPCAAMTCRNCGNTHLMNLIVLGLGDLVTEKS